MAEKTGNRCRSIGGPCRWAAFALLASLAARGVAGPPPGCGARLGTWCDLVGTPCDYGSTGPTNSHCDERVSDHWRFNEEPFGDGYETCFDDYAPAAPEVCYNRIEVDDADPTKVYIRLNRPLFPISTDAFYESLGRTATFTADVGHSTRASSGNRCASEPHR